MTEFSSRPFTIQQQIQAELQQLKSEMKLDFVSVAIADGDYRDIYWKIALGARTERYRKIMVRMGKGMAGKVLKSKSPHIVTRFPEEVQDEMLEYPIFLIESLRSGVGVSVSSTRPEQRSSSGVLLVGERKERVFSRQEIERVEQSASVLASLYDNTAKPPITEDTDEPEQVELISPLFQRLRNLHKEGVTCELLDQRVTRLSPHRQQEIAGILELLAPHCSRTLTNVTVSMEQDEIGNTVVIYEGKGTCDLTDDFFNSMKSLLHSLKSDLEISVEQQHQFFRFTIPTRQLLDEMHWKI
ncbi:hypothetical protein M3231_04520 [Neobacillus mesonae]|nr:hypothetical protein [Neobacillus mesonae]